MQLTFQFHMLNVTKVMNLRRMMSHTGLKTIKRQIYTQALFYHPGPFWPIIPFAVITFLVTFDIIIRLKLNTHLDESCIYQSQNTTLTYCTICKILLICYTKLFWDTHYLECSNDSVFIWILYTNPLSIYSIWSSIYGAYGYISAPLSKNVVSAFQIWNYFL